MMSRGASKQQGREKEDRSARNTRKTEKVSRDEARELLAKRRTKKNEDDQEAHNLIKSRGKTITG